MTDDKDFWSLVYAAAVGGGASNKRAQDTADQAVIDRAARWTPVTDADYRPLP